MVKNLPANAGDIRDLGSVPELGRSPARGHGNPLQYSCLENSVDREVCQATVHGVSEWDTTERLTLLLWSKQKDSKNINIKMMEHKIIASTEFCFLFFFLF